MSGYEDVYFAINNSREILADYNQRQSQNLYWDILIEKVSFEVEKSIQAPRALILTKLISALSIGLQPLVDVRTPDGRTVPVSCYFINLAESGERKTAIENKAFKPITDFQEKLDECGDVENKNYLRSKMIVDEKLKALKKELRKSVSKGEGVEDVEVEIEDLLEAYPEHPRDIQLVTTDCTPEALIDGMARGSKYVAIASGEGGAVLRSAFINDYPLVNGLWGGETVRKKRKATRSSTVVDGRMTISLDVQPEVFYEFLRKKGEVMHASGFFARCFMTQPASKVGSRFSWDHQEIHYEESAGRDADGCYEEYANRLTSYLEKLPGVLSGVEPRVVIKLSQAAEKKMMTITNAIEHESNPGGMFDGHKGYASKLAEKILRIACLLNVFEYGVNHDIYEGAVDHALHLGMYYAGQHLDIFKRKSSEDKDDELLLGWINKKRNHNIRFIRKNEIRQNIIPVALRISKRLNPAVERLSFRMEISRYNIQGTEYVDLMPWLPPDHRMPLQQMGSGRIY